MQRAADLAHAPRGGAVSPRAWSAERRWGAISARDATAREAFCFGVRTTGVYCRPGCPARTPRREHVAFFATPAAAEAAGYRSCKRCRPAEAAADAERVAAVGRACALIEASEQALPLAALAAAVGLSPYHFHRVFRRVTGTTPAAYARARRQARFAAQLEAGRPVAEAIYAAGFGSSSRAYAAASAALGMTPGARRRGGRGETVRYATVGTALGPVLVAATDRGLCAVEFVAGPAGPAGLDGSGGSDSAVEALRRRFAAARLQEDAAGLRPWLERVAACVAAPGAATALPLDLRGTVFQARVWEALRRIPPGTTASYAAVAAAIGRPGAARAVAAACAGNRLAVLVPCHRVVRSDGGAGGYRWGVERKRALLARERAEAGGSDSRGKTTRAARGP